MGRRRGGKEANASGCSFGSRVCAVGGVAQVLDSRSRIEKRLLDLEEKLEEMDAKFEHNIAAMNELLQKNLKYLKHVTT